MDAALASGKPAPKPREVVDVLDVDIVVLSDKVHNSWDVGACLNSAVHTLGLLHTYLSGLAGGGAPVAATPSESSTSPLAPMPRKTAKTKHLDWKAMLDFKESDERR